MDAGALQFGNRRCDLMRGQQPFADQHLLQGIHDDLRLDIACLIFDDQGFMLFVVRIMGHLRSPSLGPANDRKSQ